MSTKTKPAKGTTKKASPKKFGPITCKTTADTTGMVSMILYHQTTATLKAALRFHEIGIPKTKEEMIERLDTRLADLKTPISATIHF